MFAPNSDSAIRRNEVSSGISEAWAACSSSFLFLAGWQVKAPWVDFFFFLSLLYSESRGQAPHSLVQKWLFEFVLPLCQLAILLWPLTRLASGVFVCFSVLFFCPSWELLLRSCFPSFSPFSINPGDGCTWQSHQIWSLCSKSPEPPSLFQLWWLVCVLQKVASGCNNGKRGWKMRRYEMYAVN